MITTFPRLHLYLLVITWFPVLEIKQSNCGRLRPGNLFDSYVTGGSCNTDISGLYNTNILTAITPGTLKIKNDDVTVITPGTLIFQISKTLCA